MVTNAIVYSLFDVFHKIFALKQHDTILLHRLLMTDMENNKENCKSESPGNSLKNSIKSSEKYQQLQYEQ